MLYWGRYVGEKVEVEYDGRIIFGGDYAWINCTSERIVEIRKELGLKGATSFEGETFHFSIANCKELK